MKEFRIQNQSNKNMAIIHEPEGWEFELSPEKKITIKTELGNNDIRLVTSIEEGLICIGIWDNNGLYKVFYNDKDVFEQYYG